MINSYPIWKYCGIFFIFFIGCIYALPNFYGKDFAVLIEQQISNNQKPNDMLLFDINRILINKKIIIKSISIKMNKIQILFFSEFEQLNAYEILSSLFSENYLVSFKQLSAIPNWLVLIRAKPVTLGLDLQGGLYLIIRVDTETILNKFQEQYLDILRSHLDEKKISYTKIYKAKNYNIKIIFKNFTDKNKATSYLSNVYQDLIFHSVDLCTLNIIFSKNYIHSIYEYVMKQNITILRHRINQLKIIEPVIQRQGLNSISVELPGILDISKVKSVLSSTASLEFRLVNVKVNKFEIDNNLIPADSEIKLDRFGNIIPVYKRVILTGDHIVNSDVNFDEYYRPQVNISLDDLGSTIFSNFTKSNIGKPMATLFVEYKDSRQKNSKGYPILYKYDKIINVAVIKSHLSRNFCITGIENAKDAHHLSSLLRMGSLAAPIYIEKERMVGPILGKKNIIQGVIACSLGILVSICFMIFWYHYFGLIAGLALILNLILIISFISIVPGLVLTMPSIAGIALTLSVAIDSNVLINERIKEELKQGKPIQYSIYTGYRKAFNSIVDANVTTIITSIILYIISTGAIQGFAMVTIIGVGTSMFTSIIGTRAFVNLIYGRKNISTLSL